ncbi:MAG: UDP-N-acetylmuramoyl-tripeptide--D-alanyl-D-alanine ligase [Erysipelotrichaceae bacterium]
MINYSLEKISSIVGGQLIGDGQVVVNGIQYDSRLMQDNMIFAPFKGEKIDGHQFVKSLFEKNIKASFWQKDCPLEKPQGNLIVVDNVLEAMAKLAKYYRDSLSIKIIGVTGSSGKTSTKDIIAAVLARKYRVYKTQGNHNNIIGVPVTLINMADDIDVAVIEMGIDDIGIMDKLVEMVRPDYTVITSIAPAHIQQFKTMDKIVEQKCLINKYLPQEGYCFYNSDSYGVKEKLFEMGLENQMLNYGFTDECCLTAVDCYMENQFTCFKVKQLDYPVFKVSALGKHMALNSLAAIGIACRMGLTYQQIDEGLQQVVLTGRRMQLKQIRDCLIIDDSYNSNPASLVASLKTFIDYSKQYKKVVVLGDMLELAQQSAQLHRNIADEIDFSQFDSIILIGQQMRNLYERLSEKNLKSKWFLDWQSSLADVQKELSRESVIFFKSSNSMRFNELINALEG